MPRNDATSVAIAASANTVAGRDFGQHVASAVNDVTQTRDFYRRGEMVSFHGG